MLTSFRDGEWHRRPLTIIGTGDTPIGPVFHANPRHVFIDAPLLTLEAGFEVDGKHHEWSGEIAPMASGRWLWQLSWPSVAALRKYSAAAHSRGIKARWWGAPRLVPYVRRAIWDVQLRAGVDWMNADDLAEWVALSASAWLLARRETGDLTVFPGLSLAALQHS